MKNIIIDTLLIGKNELLIQIRNPLWLFFGLFQPVVYLTLFSPFLKGIADTPGFPAESAIQFFAPGLLIMNVMFGAAFAGFGLISQLRTGFIERLRVTPVSRLAIVLGLVLRSPIVVLIQSLILILIAVVFFGLEVSIGGLMVLVLLLILIALTMASLSFTIALMVKDEGTLAAVTNFFMLPLLLLSGVMLPVTFAPKFIQHIADFNPFTYAVDASRALVNGDYHHSAVTATVIIFTILSVLALSWFIKTMRQAVA